MLFQGVVVGEQWVDLRVRDGRIAAIHTVDVSGPDALHPEPDEDVVIGGLLTPPFAEPHVHLDAALTGALVPNRSGTLVEGIKNWAKIRDALRTEDVLVRARRTVDWYVGWGTMRIRTHVDTGSRVAVDALLGLRDELAPEVELQVVAFPQEGILRAADRREAWEAAVAAGCDVVGAIPHHERTAEEGWQSVRMAFDLAEKHDCAVDLHCDETDDPGSRNLEVVCAEALDRGWTDRVVAGHCTALHSYPNPYAAKVIDLVAESGVQVVANPLDNTVLQGRYDGYPRRRGITRVDELWAAGASVGIGHDSVMDPWYRLGTANLVDAAYMLVHVAQLTSEVEMRRVFATLHTENHRPFGSIPALDEGAPATFLWFDAADPIEVLRSRPRPRVFRDGVEVVTGEG
jgi:cytosine deaminase